MAERGQCRVCGCTAELHDGTLCSECAQPTGEVEIADAVAAALLDDCYWAAVELGIIDGLAEDDETPPVELDLTGGGW